MRMGGATVQICADDAFACPAIDDGIKDLTDAGIVTHVAALVNFRPPEAELFADATVGLHLCLTSGAPLSPAATIPSLVAAGGRFRSPTPGNRSGLDAALREELPRIAADFRGVDIAREVASQVRAFEAFFGKPPPFVAVHHDLDAISRIRGELLNLCAIRARASALASGMIAAYLSLFAGEGDSEATLAAKLAALLEQAKAASAAASVPAVIACHPASDTSPVDAAFTIYQSGRVIERDAWMHIQRNGAFGGAQRTSRGWEFPV